MLSLTADVLPSCINDCSMMTASPPYIGACKEPLLLTALQYTQLLFSKLLLEGQSRLSCIPAYLSEHAVLVADPVAPGRQAEAAMESRKQAARRPRPPLPQRSVPLLHSSLCCQTVLRHAEMWKW